MDSQALGTLITSHSVIAPAMGLGHRLTPATYCVQMPRMLIHETLVHHLDPGAIWPERSSPSIVRQSGSIP